MLVVIHILGAVTSLPFMGAALAVEILHRSGSKILLKLSAVSFVVLLASGTGLIIANHARLLGVCTSGLLYLSGLATLYVMYRKLLTREKITGSSNG